MMYYKKDIYNLIGDSFSCLKLVVQGNTYAFVIVCAVMTQILRGTLYMYFIALKGYVSDQVPVHSKYNH